MKKIILLIFICFVVISGVFAYQNTYKQSSDEVQTFLILRKLSDTMTPDPTYPISGTQLTNLLKSLNTNALDSKAKSLYDSLLSKLEHPEILFGKDGMGVDSDISILGIQLMQSDAPDTYGILPYKDRMPMLGLNTTMYMKDYMTGVFDISLRETIDAYRNELWRASLLDFNNYSEGAPDYAYASVGFDDLNFAIGRDRLEVGNGYTGNLELGGNILFDNYAKLSFVGSFMSYDFTMDSFEHDDEYLGTTYIAAKKKNIYVHRASFNFKDIINLSVYEGALVFAANPFNNLQFLNPFMYLHNTGTYYEADTNNFMGLEIAAVLPKGYQIDSQLFFDQYVTGGEKIEETGENAFEVLLNVSKAATLKNGILDSYIEFVYGNPYVYLKNTHGYGMDDSFTGWENIDLVNDSKNDYNTNSSRELQYFGYRFGGNLFSVGTGASYYLNNSTFSLDLQYICKGTNGIWDGDNRKAQDQTADPMHVITAYAGIDQNFYSAFNIQLKFGFAEYINYKHLGTNKFDPQFSIGVCIHPLEFLKNKATL